MARNDLFTTDVSTSGTRDPHVLESPGMPVLAVLLSRAAKRRLRKATREKQAA
jgi:hypothetical protein